MNKISILFLALLMTPLVSATLMYDDGVSHAQYHFGTDPTNFYDEDYSTYTLNNISWVEGYYWANYTLPGSFSDDSTLVNIKAYEPCGHTLGSWDYTIPAECLSQDPLQIQLYYDISGSINNTYSCYSYDTSYFIDFMTGQCFQALFEDAVMFNISSEGIPQGEIYLPMDYFNSSPSGNVTHGLWNEIDAEQFNGSVNNVTGVFGQAIKFDGLNDHLRIINPDFQDADEEMSVSLWIKLNKSVTGDYQWLFEYVDSGYDRVFIGLQNSRNLYLYDDIQDRGNTSSGPVLNVNQWYHIVMELFNNGTKEVYLNGTRVISNSGGYNLTSFSSGADIHIGGHHTFASGWVNGSIDEVKVFNFPLNPVQVYSLYTYNNLTTSPVNLEILSPSDKTSFFDDNISVKFALNSPYGNSSCYLTVNNTNQTPLVFQNGNNTISYTNIPWHQDNELELSLTCYNWDTINTTSNITVYFNNTNDVGLCSSSLTFQILNLSYFDDVSGNQINLTNGYNLGIYDGVNTTSITGSFSDNYSDELCTNLDPSFQSFNYELTGTFTLSKSEYVTRIYTFPEADPLILSNSIPPNETLYLIPIANSSTIVYNWYSTEYQPLDGLMRIYRCEPDGTNNLIETTVITGGEAVANLQLLTKSYAYEVIIDGQTYSEASYSTCHTEASTSRTYYVDLIGFNLNPIIELTLVYCELTKIDNHTVSMVWSSELSDDDPVSACLIGRRQTLNNLTEIYRNCTLGASGNITRSVPDNGITYYVTGEITQGTSKGYCKDTLSFNLDTEVSDLYGMFGAICAFILIIGLVLLFHADSTKMYIGAIVGVLVSAGMGLVILPWEVVVGIIFFLIIIISIIKYGVRR